MNITTEGITIKHVRLMRMTLQDSEAKVVIKNNMTESFNVNIAVRLGECQSCRLT